MPENERPPATGDLSALARRGASLSASQRMAALCHGDVEILGRMPWSSNATFLVTCRSGELEVPAVYKPEAGERPLWDFPRGIYRREVAAYMLSELCGVGLVPETVARVDAPMGVGSLQRFVPADFAHHYFTVLGDPATHDRLRLLAALDVVANNADRKGGHVLLDTDGAIWAIDHGLCFHVEPKLRTVMWDMAGQPLPDALLRPLRWLARTADPRAHDTELPAAGAGRTAGPRAHDTEPAAAGTGGLQSEHGAWWAHLCDLLDEDELRAVGRRSRQLLARGRHPHPDPRRHHYPWPLV